MRSELTLLLSLIEAITAPELPKLLQPIRSPLDDIFSPFEQAESMHADLRELMPGQIVDALVLAWHHDHLSYQSYGKPKRDHQHERPQGLDVAAGRLHQQFAPLKTWVFEKLDAVIHASALVEMVHAFIRPSLNSANGHMTQETLHLIMFYHNHRRSKGGKRQGKAPMELLTGEALEADWVDLFIQHAQEESPGPSLTSSPSLELVPYGHEPTTPSETPARQVSIEPHTESDIPW